MLTLLWTPEGLPAASVSIFETSVTVFHRLITYFFQLSLTLLFKQGLTLRTSSIHCCQSSDRWHSIDQRSLTVSICRLRFCAMRDRGESLGSSADLSVSYSSITLRPESRARSTTNRLTFSLPLNAWRRKWEQSAPCYEHLNSLLDGNPETGISDFLLRSHSSEGDGSVRIMVQ